MMAGGIWERSWSAVSIAWFTRLSSCRRQSRSVSNVALFLRMLAWVSFRDLISRRPILLKLWSCPFAWWFLSAGDDRQVVSEPCEIVHDGFRWRLQELVLLQLILGACPPILPKWYESAEHSWLVGRCLGLGIGEILGVWPWFHLIIQLNRPMSLLLLLLGKWLRFEKKTDYCLEILVPKRKMKLEWLMETRSTVKSAKGKGTYLLQTCFV